MSYSKLVLSNPRHWIKSATITCYRGAVMLDVTTIRGTLNDGAKSVRAAKQLFNRNILEPKYHGKNIWKAI